MDDRLLDRQLFLHREISLVDIAPTILNMLDVDMQDFRFDGQSILAQTHVSSHSELSIYAQARSLG